MVRCFCAGDPSNDEHAKELPGCFSSRVQADSMDGALCMKRYHPGPACRCLMRVCTICYAACPNPPRPATNATRFQCPTPQGSILRHMFKRVRLTLLSCLHSYVCTFRNASFGPKLHNPRVTCLIARFIHHTDTLGSQVARCMEAHIHRLRLYNIESCHTNIPNGALSSGGLHAQTVQ